MNSVLRELQLQANRDSQAWRAQTRAADIASCARYFEDHADAVGRSEHVEKICELLDRFGHGDRSRELLAKMKFFRKEIEDQDSGVMWQGH